MMDGGGPVQRMLDQQKRIADMMDGGGPVQRMLDQQKRIADLLSDTQFSTYHDAATGTVEQIAAELGIGSDGNVEDVLEGEARPWVPTREQAQRMADSATFVIAFVLFVVTLAGAEIPEITQRAIETLLTFAVVMTRYARR
jgi:hypothetical protein